MVALELVDARHGVVEFVERGADALVNLLGNLEVRVLVVVAARGLGTGRTLAGRDARAGVAAPAPPDAEIGGIVGEGSDNEAVEGLAEVRHPARVDGGAHRVDGGRDVSLVVVGGGRGGAGVAGTRPTGRGVARREGGKRGGGRSAPRPREETSPFVATEARSPDERRAPRNRACARTPRATPTTRHR